MTAHHMTLQMSTQVDEYSMQYDQKTYVLRHYFFVSPPQGAGFKSNDQTVTVDDPQGKLFTLTTEGAKTFPLTLRSVHEKRKPDAAHNTLYTLIENSVNLMAARDESLRFPAIYAKAQPDLFQAMRQYVADQKILKGKELMPSNKTHLATEEQVMPSDIAPITNTLQENVQTIMAPVDESVTETAPPVLDQKALQKLYDKQVKQEWKRQQKDANSPS